MLDRFQGAGGRRLRVDALTSQKIVSGNRALAEELADRVKLRLIGPGEILIEQGGSDNAIYLVLAGAVNIVVNGRVVGRRAPNDHLGEMAAVVPAQKRSATVVAIEDTVVAELSEPDLADLGRGTLKSTDVSPKSLLADCCSAIHWSMRSETESECSLFHPSKRFPLLGIIQNAFQHDPFTTVV